MFGSLFLTPGGHDAGTQLQGGTNIVPSSHAMSHLIGGGLGFAIRVLELGLGLELELAIERQPQGGTGVVPGTQTIPHLNGSRLTVGVPAGT